MTLYPEVHRTAQRELDVIVGAERLPEMDVCVCQCSSYGMSSMFDGFQLLPLGFRIAALLTMNTMETSF